MFKANIYIANIYIANISQEAFRHGLWWGRALLLLQLYGILNFINNANKIMMVKLSSSSNAG